MGSILVGHTDSLFGNVPIQGAKNSALPILAATILCTGTCIVNNCPDLSDVNSTVDILKALGAKVKKKKNCITVDSSNINSYIVPQEMMTKLRSSILFLGSVVSRMGKAELYLPGGCKLGPRPIDWHLKALSDMGLEISLQNDMLKCETYGKLKGTQILLPLPSVGATENIILAAVLARGTTIIKNAAREPEICDLCNFLSSCGARIFGAGSSTIEIIGVDELYGTEHNVIPDRIVAATFMSATAITTGKVTLLNVVPKHLKSISKVIKKSGCMISTTQDTLTIESSGEIKSVGKVITDPYPGFPTDAQALIMAMCTIAKGNSEFVENIFENRYKHVEELLKLGADINVVGKKAIVNGVESLYGNHLKAKDLRGAAALIVASLAAKGETIIEGSEHLDRGYENFELHFKNIGANIKRI